MSTPYKLMMPPKRDVSVPSSITLSDVTVAFGEGAARVTALSGMDLVVKQGEFLSLLGPSGCGKSTLLRLVSDLIQPAHGEVKVFGEAPAVARSKREIAFVFQEATLLPWRTALQNVTLPLEVGGSARHAKGGRSPMDLLELVGLGKRADALPHELSGGMRQRVAIARALVTQPKILLMDEPFGALDEITRDRLNVELLQIWKDMDVTVLFVTHSIAEAAFLGQRVVVMTGTPGTVAGDVDIQLPKQRNIEIRDTLEFVEISSNLRRLLKGGSHGH